MLTVKFWSLFLLVLVFEQTTSVVYEDEKTAEFWTSVAQKELEDALKVQKLNLNKAKNIIIFVGDGMGVSTVTAGRIFKGQKEGAKGEETKLAIDKMDHIGLSKVYNLNKQVPDSSATATAFLTGVKANFFTVGVNGQVQFENCSSQAGNEVYSVLVDAYNAGKSTGIVSTTTLVHGTPAASYAHSASRAWVDDSNVGERVREEGCKDLAEQFLEASDMITVTLSGGRTHMLPQTTTDPEYPDKTGSRLDRRDLIKLWEDKMKQNGLIPKYVWNKEQFDTINVARTDRLLGLFEHGDMQFDMLSPFLDGAGEPSLEDMTEKAIKMLRKNDNGYFLLVEGGRIDHGHHANMAMLAVTELVAFDKAVAKAIEITSSEDTLIIVTADHGHPFTISGYAERGNDILGLVKDDGQPELAFDKKTFTTLTYGNGPGFHGVSFENPLFGDLFIPDLRKPTTRVNISDSDTKSPSYMYQTAIPLIVDTHSGEDVAIYANGPMAHLIHGTHEQNYIAHMIRYAACIGGINAHCANNDQKEKSGGTKFDPKLASLLLIGAIGLSASGYLAKRRFS